jgi:hypothetical protein
MGEKGVATCSPTADAVRTHLIKYSREGERRRQIRANGHCRVLHSTVGGKQKGASGIQGLKGKKGKSKKHDVY